MSAQEAVLVTQVSQALHASRIAIFTQNSARAKRPATANSTQHFLILPHLAPTLVEVLPLLLVSRKLIDTASRIAWQIDTS